MVLCQAHYPERADKVFIVNAPMFFSALWKIISPIMDPRTKAKLSISSSKVCDELIAYIGAESVPKQYGGTLQCSV